MKYLSILMILIIFSSCNYGVVSEKDISIITEYAYYEGQKDALDGDIRIAKDSTSLNRYKWVKSPNDNGDLPVYDPNKAISEQLSVFLSVN